MLRKLIVWLSMLILLFSSQSFVHGKGNNIEVMDVKQGKIMKHIPNTEAIQKEVRQFITTITGLSPSVRIEPRDGIAYKIPVEPPITYGGKWFSTVIDEVILMVGSNEEPRLLIFDDENKPYVVVFEHDIREVLKTNEVRNIDYLSWEVVFFLDFNSTQFSIKYYVRKCVLLREFNKLYI